jgi:hypothetical protein
MSPTRTGACGIFVRTVVAASVTVVAVGSARGDDARDALGAFVQCADIADSAKRLECFDAATARGKAALAAPPAQTAQPPKEKASRLVRLLAIEARDQAGRLRQAATAAGPNEVTQISDGVLEFAKTARGKAIFILENGQVWRQIDGDAPTCWHRRGHQDEGDDRSRRLGSYNLTIDGRKGLIKVNRLK